MVRIGLIGEDPNDTTAITHLLQQRFNKGFRYITLSPQKRGSQIFNDASVRSYNIEIMKDRPHHIIVIIDADSIVTENAKIKKRKSLYNKLSRQLNCKSLLLLNIYELEALILADIEGFNKHYQTKVNFKGNVSYQQKPKEYLQEKSARKYQVAHCAYLFLHLNFDTILQNCAYFKTFVADFEKAIKPI